MKTTNPRRAGRLPAAGAAACLAAILFFPTQPAAQAADPQIVHASVPQLVSKLTPLRALDTSRRLRLVIGLPVRDPAGLTSLLQQLYDPSSTNYQRWQTPAQLAARFGASDEDLQSVSTWAVANGLNVASVSSNRLVIEVEGSVGDIEKALHVTLHEYNLAAENRTIYAPDASPSLDLAVPIQTIDGLNNYFVPQPNSHLVSPTEAAIARAQAASNLPAPASVTGGAAPAGGATASAGSGPSGNYAGCDFRAAYVPGTALNGSGQSVGLLQFNNFYQSDITAYENAFGIPNVPIVDVPVAGGFGSPSMPGNDEVSLDIEMVLAMAPNVASIYVYEAPNLIANWVPLLSRMQADNFCKQLSCSWFGGAPNATAEDIFQLMAAQGQSFFCAAGDHGAWTNTGTASLPFPLESPNITLVGGTSLSTAGPCGAYGSESVWNSGLLNGEYWETAGGVAPDVSIPWWQQSTLVGPALGSATLRNIPDVALTADNIWVYYNNGSTGSFIGTSCASPLWAGFTALANQKAMGLGRPPVGFLNPALYSIGNSPGYATAFNDVTVGNNEWPSSPTRYFAVRGFDLCTGWGTPKAALINYLAGLTLPDSLLGNGGFETGDLSDWTQGGNTGSTFASTAYAHSGSYGLALGPVGSLGSLSQSVPTVPGQSYVISFWLEGGGNPSEFKVLWNGVTLLDLASPSPSGWTEYRFTVTATGSSSALEFDFRNDPSFFGLDDIGVTPAAIAPPAALVANNGFETGDFTGWTHTGNTSFDSVSGSFAHSGAYGAELGPVGSLGTLSQTLQTKPGGQYLVSFWLENPYGGSPTEFKMVWDGATYMDTVNPPVSGWTRYQFTVTASSSTTLLEFDYRNDPGYWGLDDITVSPVFAPGLTFDDLPAATSGSLSVPNRYGGVTWYNFFYTDGYHYASNPSGYGAGVISPENVAYDGFGDTATISNSVPFNLNSAYLTAAWNDNLQVEAKGYLHGQLMYDRSYTLSATAPTLVTFGFYGVTEVDFIPSGGTPHAGYTGSGTHFAMDNVSITLLQGLTFDDLPYPGTSGIPVPAGYGDLTWNNFDYLDGVHYSIPSGYLPGAVSQVSAAFNANGNPASMISSVPFNLNSAYLTAAWNDNLQVEAKGYLHGGLLYDRTYTLSATEPARIEFNFQNVDEVDFTSSGGTPHAGYTGSGAHFAIDNIDKTYPAPQFEAAYLRSSIGEPWGTTDSDTAMDRVFGTNLWQDLRYESVDPSALFTPATHFIYMEGSDNNFNAMEGFLTANESAIHSWVNNGGTLFINAAPNQGSGGNLGFGVTLVYDGVNTFTTNGMAADPANPIFQGPFTPVGTSWYGYWFAHATLTGDGGLIPLIYGTNGLPVLAELWPGSGHVLFGGMTENSFHGPQPEADNLRANILAYGSRPPGTFEAQGTFDDLADPGSTGVPVPNGYLGVNWNNFYYVSGSLTGGGFLAGTISASNCAYNAYANPASITSPNPFDLHSAYLTAGWNDNLQVEVKGYTLGTLTYDQTYTLQATMPTLVHFEFLGVTEVDFSSSGGAPHAGYPGSGAHFVMDNVSLSTGDSVASGVDHFLWDVVPSPECMNAPFAVTITAKDAYNNTIAGFDGNVSLNGWSGVQEVDNFDSATWPHAPWTFVTPTSVGTNLVSFAHDGSKGLSDPEWAYRTDVSVGNAGDVLSWWVRPGAAGNGRAYLGFAAAAGGAWSVVVAPNTSEFLIQQDIPYGTYNDKASDSQTYLPGKWYKVAVKFNSPNSVTAYLYDSDGLTLVNTLSCSGITGAPGGVAMRSFSGMSIDTIETGNPSMLPIAPTFTGAFINGVWTGSIEATQPASTMILSATEGLRGASGSSNPFQVVANVPTLTIAPVVGGVSVCWNTCVGGKYQLQRKNGSLLNAWSNVGSQLTATGSSLCVLIAEPPPTNDFFRVISIP